MRTQQPEWTLNNKIPIIWVIDDFNTALASSYRRSARLFGSRQGLNRLRKMVDETKACLSINFVIAPEYARAGLSSLADLEIPMRDPSMRPYHEELQAWLYEMGNRVEVTVHGWSHRMESYSGDVEINPGGWEYTRRSEWLHNPNPVSNYKRCIDTLCELGYHPIPHAFSNCGGRMDHATLWKLRKSEFGVLTKFPTQPEACLADYPDVPEMPWYLEDIDAFVLPSDLRWTSEKADFEAHLDDRKPLFLINHGYEFCDPWFRDIHSHGALLQFVLKHADKIIFVRYGDYVKIMHENIRHRICGK